MSEVDTTPEPIPSEVEIAPRVKQVRTEKQLVALERARNAKKVKREARLKEQSAPVSEVQQEAEEDVETQQEQSDEPGVVEPQPEEPDVVEDQPKSKPKRQSKKPFTILKR